MGFLLDLAELKDHDKDLEAQEISQQVANLFIAEGAADLKSRFLANVSFFLTGSAQLENAHD